MSSPKMYKQLKKWRIAVLTLPHFAETNEESRKASGCIVDVNYAKFRASAVKVVAIYDMFDRSKTYNKGRSQYDPNFVYRVGQVARVCNFSASNEVCTTGIHYFLCEDAAFYFDNYGSLETALRKAKYTGSLKVYHSNGDGRLLQETDYVDGQPNGKQLCYRYTENGERQLATEAELKDGAWHVVWY